MKKAILFILFSIISFAQVPQGMSHRGTAYNSNGSILSNTQIIVRVKILEGSATGTLVFEELHTTMIQNNQTVNLQTNLNGQYSITIGTGTQQGSNIFSSINWGSGQKWLEIGIAPVSNPTNFVTGSSQLMSVPYALYANFTNHNNSLKVVINISELRDVDNPNLGDVIYVKGHTTQGDGGGGNFIWRNENSLTDASSVFSIDNDGTIIKSNKSNTGRWVRQFTGYIDVRFFGALGNSSVCTDKIQKAIDFASNNANLFNPPTTGTTVFFPSGSYIIDKIILKNGISLIGDSFDKTILNATVSGDTGFTNSPYLFEIDKGPIQISMSNFNIYGRDTDKGCFFFEAKTDNSHGGLWYSNFKNIKISRFKGHGIYSKGGGLDGTIPNQFLIFENLRAQRFTDNSNALKISGQHGQITFLNCQFDGSKDCEGCSRNKLSNVDISHDNYNSSAVISFINSTFQDSDYGISIKYAENITIDNCWFESLGISINIDGTEHECKGINIVNNRFANAAGFGSLTSQGNILQGRCINIINSQVNIANNYVAVSSINSQSTDDLFILATNNNYDGISLSNNTFSDFRLGKTFGIMQTTSIEQVNYCTTDFNCNSLIKGINTFGKKLVFVTVPIGSNSTSNQINRINSTILAGESIFIRANQGPITFNSMNSVNGNEGKNIFLNGRSILTLQNGQAATFIKIDNIVGNEKCTYQLVSISN